MVMGEGLITFQHLAVAASYRSYPFWIPLRSDLNLLHLGRVDSVAIGRLLSAEVAIQKWLFHGIPPSKMVETFRGRKYIAGNFPRKMMNLIFISPNTHPTLTNDDEKGIVLLRRCLYIYIHIYTYFAKAANL